MIDPVTATIIATAVSSAIKGGGEFLAGKKQKKAAKSRAVETKRETLSGLLNDAAQGSAELHSHGLSSRAKLGKRKSQSLQDTSDLVRGAFNI